MQYKTIEKSNWPFSASFIILELTYFQPNFSPIYLPLLDTQVANWAFPFHNASAIHNEFG